MKILKGLFFASVFLFLGTFANAQELSVSKVELPQNATKFIQSHFSDTKVLHAHQDTDDGKLEYKVHLENGVEIEFDKDGNWKEIDGNSKTSIATTFVDKNILTYISSKYPNVALVKIEKNSRKYEVDLSNGVDLDFDLNGNFLKVD